MALCRSSRTYKAVTKWGATCRSQRAFIRMKRHHDHPHSTDHCHPPPTQVTQRSYGSEDMEQTEVYKEGKEDGKIHNEERVK